MNKTTITLSAISVLLVTILGGVILTDTNVFYCEDRALVMSCDKLTSYYQLDNGKCWNAEIGNKLCRTGWLEVKEDVVGNTTEEHEGIMKIYKGREWTCESMESNSLCFRGGTHQAYRYQIE